jgi:2',3'-cyclic-nucleotide 2'-phosphodiesterase (5'-nucleotidase family)
MPTPMPTRFLACLGATATLVLVGLARPAAATAADDHLGCVHQDEYDGQPLRRLAEKIVAWHEARLPPASDPRKWQKVQLLGINDFHGALSPRKLGTADVGGAAYLAAYLKKAAAEAAGPTFVVHAGDHVGASPPNSALLQDEPSVSFLNLVGNSYCGYWRRLDPRCNLVGTPGNHEFDEGKGELLRLIHGGNHPKGPFLEPTWRGATFPYVSANVVDARTRLPILPPFVIKQVSNRVNVAFVGAVLKGTPSIVTPAGVAGLQFLDEAEAINRTIPFIKALGVKAIVVTIHEGGFQTNNTGGAGGPDPAVAALVAAADGRVAPVVNQVVAQTTAPLTRGQNAAGESALGNLIADAQRWKMGTDFAFMNPGGVRADVDAGPVTWGDLFAVQPFANDLVTMKLTGQQVLDLLAQQFAVGRILQVSGLRFSWRDGDGAGNGPLLGALMGVTGGGGGAAIDPAASYTVTVNSFLAGGGDNFTVLRDGADRVVGPVDLDALVEYVQQLAQPIGAGIEGRVTLVP